MTGLVIPDWVCLDIFFGIYTNKTWNITYWNLNNLWLKAKSNNNQYFSSKLAIFQYFQSKNSLSSIDNFYQRKSLEKAYIHSISLATLRYLSSLRFFASLFHFALPASLRFARFAFYSTCIDFKRISEVVGLFLLRQTAVTVSWRLGAEVSSGSGLSLL